MSIDDLADRVRVGDIRATARAVSLVEDEHPDARLLVTALHAHAGHAGLIGITGPPGAGKSTLVDQLTTHLRAAGLTVGILAVDPSSPCSGGALLGDRIRMHRHALDAGVFVRSMATRGTHGGLARATADAALVLDAAGFDLVLIETVGVGQDEIDIVRTADVTVVVLVPGTGDDVQALKAGLMEIADVFVVNKADREGADRAVSAIESMLALRGDMSPAWRPPVVRTQATTGDGIAALWAAISTFRSRAPASGGERHRANAAWRLRTALAQRLLRHVDEVVLPGAAFDVLVEAIAARTADPYSVADDVLAQVLGAASGVPPTPRRLDKSGPGLHDVALAVDRPPTQER